VAGPGSRRGLGLALVQQVAARRGGEVTVINKGGALFTVRLPLFTKPAWVATP
jgi:signal transduction histidine kinase